MHTYRHLTKTNAKFLTTSKASRRNMGKRKALNFKPYSLHGTFACVHIPSCKLGSDLTRERDTRLVSYIESLLWEREREETEAGESGVSCQKSYRMKPQ